jgi:formamidopyrimidine-DNA glycosylase
LYQAAIHPEQYSNTISQEALKTLHQTIHSVTTTAAKVLGDSSQFPADWLFSYRWGKSKTSGKKGGKESNVLPNGEKIIHITVGGRTSAVVESRQKKIKSNNNESGDEGKVTAPKKGKKVKEEDSLKGEAKKSRTANVSGVDTKVKRKAKEEIESDGITPTKRRVSARR